MTRITPIAIRVIVKIAIYLFMFAFLGYFLLPLAWLLLAGTKTYDGLYSSFGFWFAKDFVLFENVKFAFSYDKGVFVLWLQNTIIYAVCAALGSTLVSALAGYAFSQYRFAGQKFLFGAVLGSVFVPLTVFAVPLYLLISKSGLSGSLLVLILPALASPFGVYLMRIHADQVIPQDLIDAARVDGAGELRIFATIALRLMTPGCVTVLLLAFVTAWNNYFLPTLILTRSQVYTLTVGLAGGAPMSVTIVGSIISTLPVMVAFLFLQRFWQNGLALGSIKG